MNWLLALHLVRKNHDAEALEPHHVVTINLARRSVGEGVVSKSVPSRNNLLQSHTRFGPRLSPFAQVRKATLGISMLQ